MLDDTQPIRLGEICGLPTTEPLEVADLPFPEFLARVYEELVEKGERATLRHSFRMRRGEQAYWIAVVESYHLYPQAAWSRLLTTIREIGGDHEFTTCALQVFGRIPDITRDLLAVLG